MTQGLDPGGRGHHRPASVAPMAQGLNVASLLAQIQEHEAWAVIRRKAAPVAGLVAGSRSVVGSVMDIALEEGQPDEGRSVDRLVAVPFHHISERGFVAIEDDTPLVVVDIEQEHEVPVAALLEALPDCEVEIADRGGFETDDATYARIVERIISDEIGHGEAANLVIGRPYRAVIAEWDAARALTVFRRLLEHERGAYWTFCFFTGDRYLIGASPERHVSVAGSEVRMNPISGTFRVPTPGQSGLPATTEGADEASAELKRAFLTFLADEKEIYELFMVVDEELKMMCDICHEGGQVLGPYLKAMTHLIHTEYLLAGRSARDPREILRDTMYAATVTGAPVESACRLIADYETHGRGYYGAALALFGRDRSGGHTMDSPIVIRTADVDLHGGLTVTAGATLVRDSDPGYEVAETHVKARGVLSAFGLEPRAPSDGGDLAALVRDEDVTVALGSRNQRLSRFWLTSQSDTPTHPDLVGKKVAILHGEDEFVTMLRHMFGTLGLTSWVVRHEDYSTGVFDDADLVVVGPGPGDPRQRDHPKIAAYGRAIDDLLAGEQPFLAICLGHQVLCDRLGLDLEFKDIVFQGTQSPVSIEGHTERVGFYNTFVARAQDDIALPDGVELASDPVTGDVHAVSGPHYRGVQFHAESILTERGETLLLHYILAVLLQ